MSQQPCAEVYLERARPQDRLPTPREVRVAQAEYAHEAVVITYPYDAKLQAACRKGKPVKVRWGWPPETSEFVGYVHHVVNDHQPDRDRYPRLLHVVCVGATDALNRTAFAQYRDTRADAVISDVAQRNLFSVLIERHNFIWPLLQQEGESSWAFLVATAKQIGWTLYARGTDIRSHSRAIRYPGAVLFRDPQNQRKLERGGLHSFDVINGETLKVGAVKRQRVARGVDSNGTLFTVTAGLPGALAGVRATVPDLVQNSSSAAPSIVEAEALLLGEQELNRHHIDAKATTSGDARVHPASAIRVIGVDKDNDGFWYVTRAEHIMTSTSYTMRLELGRDSTGDPTGAKLSRVTPGDTAIRTVVHRGLGITSSSQNQTAPESRYVGPAAVSPMVTVQAAQRWQAAVVAERTLPPVARPAAVPGAAPLPGIFEVSHGR